MMSNKENYENNNKLLFYGVSLPSDPNKEDTSIEQHSGINRVFDNMREASEAVKKLKGSRFKPFDNINDAILFSKTTIVTKEVDSSDVNQINSNFEKSLSPFNGLHPRDLSKLRKAIESNSYSTVEELIKTNPRFLVSSCDTPSILMEGPRYNACHISAKFNRHHILTLILNTVSEKHFWKTLYPFDRNEITESRIKFLLDLYLNNSCSERASCDTPLHLGCKWGSLETVSILLSYPNCDIEKTNKFGVKPSDLICERKGDKSLKIEIIKLFESQIYIPLIRDDFSAQIGKPFKGNIETNKLNGEVAAVAGPMSPKQAEQLYKTLKSPHKCTPKDRSIRLTDSRKGLERIARNLCAELDINWKEFWPFLNRNLNLSSDEGLDLLERHLRNIYYVLDKHSLQNSSSKTEDFDDKSNECSELLSQMSKLSLNSSDISFADKQRLNEESIQCLNDCSVLELYSEDSASNDSFTSALSSPTFLYDFYINGSNITREDIDAALALQHIINSDRCLPYDFTQNWFRRVLKEKTQHFDCLSSEYLTFN